jgi:hypothetical protein
MIDVLATALTFAALVPAAWAAVLIVVGTPVQLREWHGLWLYGALALLEVGLLAQLVTGIVRLVSDDPQIDRLTFVGYLVGILLVLPLAGFWALAERTRWGPAVVVVGSLAVPILIVRLRQLWETHV